MTESAEKEPTMEEILSSIRRIISEEDEESPEQEAQADEDDEDEPEPAAAEDEPEPEAREAADEEVLDLTEPLDDEADVEPAFTPEDVMEESDILVLDQDEPEAEMAAVAPEAQEEEIKHAGIGDPEPEARVETAGIGDRKAVDGAPGAAAMDWSQEDSMSDRLLSDQAASAAVGAFAKLARSTRVPEGDDKTLEAIVRELMKPMLKDWLDRNLPAIVEKKVAEEVERLARNG